MAKRSTPKTVPKLAQQKKPAARKTATAKRAAPAKKAAAKKAAPIENSGKTVGRVENLTPFQPGQSGNPGGRPRLKPLSDAYRKALSEVDPNDKQKRTRAEVIAEAVVARAIQGDVRALQELTDRAEGKVTQPISGPDEGPLNIQLSGMTPEERDKAMDDAAERLGYKRR